MKKYLVLIPVLLIVAISGCTQTGQTSGTANSDDYEPYASSCNREAEAHIETDRALEYCKTHPYGTYRGSVCGVPVTVVC